MQIKRENNNKQNNSSLKIRIFRLAVLGHHTRLSSRAKRADVNFIIHLGTEISSEICALIEMFSMARAARVQLVLVPQ